MFSCPSQGAILHAPFEDHCYNGGLHQWFSKLASHQKDLGNIRKKKKKKSTVPGAHVSPTESESQGMGPRNLH